MATVGVTTGENCRRRSVNTMFSQKRRKAGLPEQKKGLWRAEAVLLEFFFAATTARVSFRRQDLRCAGR